MHLAFNYRRGLVVLAACLCLTPCAALAQSTIFSGTVISKDGQPLENAHVLLDQGKYYDISNRNGHFVIQDIKPGSYFLTVNMLGYQPFSKKIKIGEEGLTGFTARLSAKSYMLGEIVVTATRTRKMLEDVPLPVTVIQKEQIKDSGSMRLSDILFEQTGLRLVSDHGIGLQIQGFSPEYTLIMINGQPIIGRRAGTLDLNRISIGNVKRIEIIKGPSSALWGSSALAGVVNLITEKANQPFSLNVNSRYGTHQTFDLGATLSWQTSKWRNTFFVNRLSSAGYRLVPNTISQTVPEYQNYTLSYRTDFSISERVSLNFYGRFYEGQKNINSFLGDIQSPTMLDIDENTRNYGLNPSLAIDVTDELQLDVSHYISGYRNERQLVYQTSGNIYESNIFDQTYYKTDLQATQAWNSQNTSVIGVGVNREKLNSDRYAGQTTMKNLFVYGQHDWAITPKLNAIAGFRYDDHNIYGSQFSPKFSIQYKLTNWLHLRASTGRGFKAPTFSQLFLSYTNPTVGYSAFGTAIVKEGVKKLQEAGKVDEILREVNQIQPIEAEHAWAFNAGFDLIPTSDVRLKVNFFQNSVNNLIDVAPVAIKTNGQLIYTYFNLNQAYTRGVEAQVNWHLFNNLKLAFGYQYLLAKQRLEDTRTVQNEQGNPVEKTFTFYKPMFNRSKHSGTFKVFYEFEQLGLEANLRGTYRGSYGFSDTNGNGYVDSGEYQDGYMIWNTAVSKSLQQQYTIQLGVDNLFNFTRPRSLSSLSGRLFYIQVSLNL